MAQTGNGEFPEVGRPMPDFHFDDVQYYAKEKVTLADFKGQWLVSIASTNIATYV